MAMVKKTVPMLIVSLIALVLKFYRQTLRYVTIILTMMVIPTQIAMIAIVTLIVVVHFHLRSAMII